jgi:hypothetical protein
MRRPADTLAWENSDTSRIAWAKLMARVGPDWGELVQAHNDRDVLQASPDELPAIDIHSL